MSKHIIRTAAMAGTLAAASFASMNTALAQDGRSLGLQRQHRRSVELHLFRGVTLVERSAGDSRAAWMSSTRAVSTPAPGRPTSLETTAPQDTPVTYEVDLYAGYGGAVNDDFSYDFNAVYFLYPGDGRDFDYSWNSWRAPPTSGLPPASLTSIWGEADTSTASVLRRRPVLLRLVDLRSPL
jgi:hypothetical protein